MLKFIHEKQLDFFNFEISGYKKDLILTVDVSIEEVELWQDYLKLLEFIAENI